jgi:hypothetical protein
MSEVSFYFAVFVFRRALPFLFISNYIQSVKRGVPGFRDKSRNQCMLRYGWVNVSVGILGDQFLGHFILPKD